MFLYHLKQLKCIACLLVYICMGTCSDWLKLIMKMRDIWMKKNAITTLVSSEWLYYLSVSTYNRLAVTCKMWTIFWSKSVNIPISLLSVFWSLYFVLMELQLSQFNKHRFLFWNFWLNEDLNSQLFDTKNTVLSKIAQTG